MSLGNQCETACQGFGSGIVSLLFGGGERSRSKSSPEQCRAFVQTGCPGIDSLAQTKLTQGQELTRSLTGVPLKSPHGFQGLYGVDVADERKVVVEA